MNEASQKNNSSRISRGDHLEKATKLQEIYEPLRPHLKRIEEELSECYTSENSVLKKAFDVHSNHAGKLLRPILVLLSGKATGSVTPKHYRIATIAELIHSATLIHDDVLDEAEMRRSSPSMNQALGNELAVLFGDFIFSNAFFETVKLSNPEFRKHIARTARDVCEGEILQTGNKYNFKLDKETYMEIIERKTGSLFSMCAHLGAAINDVSEPRAKAFQKFGHDFGVAFQMIDDYLDLAGEESLIGKSLGTDIFKGKMTLPVIQLFSEMDDEERTSAINLVKNSIEKLSQSKNQEQRKKRERTIRAKLREEYSHWLNKYDLRKYTRNQAEKHLKTAKEAISDDTEFTQEIEKIIEFALNRKL